MQLRQQLVRFGAEICSPSSQRAIELNTLRSNHFYSRSSQLSLFLERVRSVELWRIRFISPTSCGRDLLDDDVPAGEVRSVKNFKIRVQVSGNRPGFEIYLSERVGSHSVPDFDITNLHVEGTLTAIERCQY